MNDNFCLVLCYANWCGHCTRYYIKEDGKEKEIEKDSPLKNLKELKELKDGDKLPEVQTWQEVREYVEKVLNKCKVTQLEHKEIVPDDNATKDEVEEFYKKNLEFDLKTMKPDGWPTIMMCKRENEKEKYKFFRLFKGYRTNLEHIKKFIEDCINGVEEKNQEGGGIDYRMKYKKYKQLYSELVDKYNTLKNKNH